MSPRRALIIETREGDAQDLNASLAGGGYQVAVTANGEEAIRLAEELLPDVVLLGIQSQDLNGAQILQSLKKRGTIRHLPVIMLLDKFDEQYVAQGLEMGAEDYLLKPIDPELLLRRVGVLARLRQQERQQRDVLAGYKELFDGEQQGLFLSTRKGRFLDVNQKLAELLGYGSRDELLTIDIEKDLYRNPQDRTRFQEVIEGQGFIRDFKVEFKRKDGQIITMLLNGRVVRDERGEIIGYEGYNVDISDRPESTGSALQPVEEQRFVARFLKQLAARVYPFRGEPFSLTKMTELIGGRYEKVERLGLGGFGEIWKVRDIEREGRMPYYVAKIPRSKKLNGQFRKEAAICRQLQNHPNAIRLFDVVEERGRVVLIQEYVAGQSLKELLDRSLEEKEKQRIVVQLVDIVAHAHQQRIVHRDVKPENILVRTDGLLKLLDYGVAKELKNCDVSNTMVGSRPYMAPEQIMGESQVASDVWALGVIMYLIYTEYLPFFDDNEKALMDQILAREPKPPRKIEPDIAVELEEIILKCLKKNPKERYADAGVLKESILEKFPDFGKN